MPLEKVNPGDPLKISARAWNAFVDAANLAKQRGRIANIEQYWKDATFCRILNDTQPAMDLDRFSVVGLRRPIIRREDNPNEFYNQYQMIGEVPKQFTHEARFAVLLEPIKHGKIGWATVAGYTPVKIRLVNPGVVYACAEIFPDDVTVLRNEPHGTAHIQWIEDNGQTEQWAIVKIDRADYQMTVIITSSTKDADGYYPGVAQLWNPVTKEWISLYECKVLDMNDG